MTLLGYERGEAAATLPIRFQGEIDRLLLMAKERGVSDDPLERGTAILAWKHATPGSTPPPPPPLISVMEPIPPQEDSTLSF